MIVDSVKTHNLVPVYLLSTFVISDEIRHVLGVITWDGAITVLFRRAEDKAQT